MLSEIFDKGCPCGLPLLVGKRKVQSWTRLSLSIEGLLVVLRSFLIAGTCLAARILHVGTSGHTMVQKFQGPTSSAYVLIHMIKKKTR